jgi:hypothetical protein
MQWHLLIVLSAIQELDEKRATKENLTSSLSKEMGKKISNIECEKIKSKLSRQLQKLFGIDDEPFYPYKDYNFYKTKFRLRPLPDIRGSGEPFIAKSRYYDAKKYN